ncbi:MAG: hypothetical protein ACT4QE_16330 [Anaerolineales bacterium]
MPPQSLQLKPLTFVRLLLVLSALAFGASQPLEHVTAAPQRVPIRPQSLTCNSVLGDGDFESLMSPWEEIYPDLHPSLPPPAPIAFCDGGSCDVSPAQLPAGPYNGEWWAWFGGGITDTAPIQSITQAVSQTVTLPAGQSASLSFHLWISRADVGTDASDVLRVALGNTTFFTATAQDKTQYSTYRPVRLNLSTLAAGLPAVFTVSATTRAAQNTPPPIINFNVDSIQMCSPGVFPVYLPLIEK